MGEKYTREVLEPVSIMPARKGTRAVWRDTQTGRLFADPIIAWAVVAVHLEHYDGDRLARTDRDRNRVEGMIVAEFGIVRPACEDQNHCGYTEPGETLETWAKRNGVAMVEPPQEAV